MRILVDINHPAHVHLFKNLIFHFLKQDHQVLVTSRKKDAATALLDYYQIPHLPLSSPAKNPLGMARELLKRDIEIFRLNKKFRFDISLGTSVSIAHLTQFSGVPSFNFNEDDDDYVPLYTHLSYPFSTKIINPVGLRYRKWSSKRIFHPSMHELAYLHPDHFQSDSDVVRSYGLEPYGYIIVRLSALQAHHDLGASGIAGSLQNRIEDLLKGESIIYSKEITQANRIKPWDMHQILAQAKMLISDSQTMTIEAAVLGVPSVRYSSFVGRSSVISELENKYQLSFGYRPGDEDGFLGKIFDLVADRNLRAGWENKKGMLLKEKINLNKWMIEYFSKL